MRTLELMRMRRVVDEPVIVVVAHPDDETITMGAQLARFSNVRIVQLTDGAPRDGLDAAAHGFASVAQYAQARAAELAAALRTGDASHVAVERLGLVDQEACRALAPLARELARTFDRERPRVVFVHAYEGGHPDHDSASFAVHAASAMLARRKRARPRIVEAACYHAGGGKFVTNEFLPSRNRVVSVELDAVDAARKRRMIDCFGSQRRVLSAFGCVVERFRESPGYDFTQAPHSGALHYETLGWTIDGAAWRAFAASALAELGLR